MKAFYYDYNYYLLPEEYENISDFVKTADFARPIFLKHLSENKCMAPYFVLEEIKQEEVMINSTQFIFPVDVTILTREEYDSRLRTCVDSFCPGCVNYGGDSSDLEGHHEEISLDRTCFLRREENDFEFSYAVDYFWYLFSENKINIEKLIDEAKIDEAIQVVTELFNFMRVPYISFTKHQEKYILMMSGLGNELENVLVNYVVKCCDEQVKTNWDVYGYLPKDIFQVSVNEEPKLYYQQVDIERTKFNVLVILPARKSEDLVTETYLGLCCIIGENRIEAAINRLQFVNHKGRDLYNNERIVNIRKIIQELITVEEFSKIIDDTYSETDIFNAPECFNTVFDIEPDRIKNDRKDVLVINSIFPSMDTVLLLDGDEFYDEIENMGISIGSLSFNITLRNSEDTKAFEYIAEVFDENFKSTNIVANFSMQIATNRFIINFLIMNKKLVRKTIRDLTPIFKTYNVVYSEISTNKRINYLVDYTLREK